ncbi:lysylphosphatidylglycerol synthase transmembrane domain-containing protein [Stenotrophomonas sp. ZAC14D2_NAIMI4_6]|uniref:lysylphosphatidylglycerol synthase transmembrane domain-containing protein n=1 Tax=Stenotrophomonas sp. ZAC14D2_NAIMI4_6 TaxID=2072406 RepID=UPI001F1F0DC6|nr:lysylphosphatidylglycerol synthase transmembrane domain-containing protein [Stenotrophomonas sp. ZAC14D2_NAIMI4_6]
MRPLPTLPRQPAKVRHQRWQGIFFLLLVSSSYLGLMLFVDRDTHVLSRLAELRAPLALCALMVLGSFLLRYQRWHYLLRAQGHQVPWREGLRAYIAGFAFTASPGKAGELLRIRYFGNLNVPAHTVLATFIAERALDLLIIILLGVGAATLIPAFGVLATLVAGCLVLLYLAGRWPWLLHQISSIGARLPGVWTRRLATFMVAGVRETGPLLRPQVALPGLLLGTLAWLLTALAFAALCSVLGLSISWQHSLGIYPIAMLAGAASFVPGGVGTTEAAIVLMLNAIGASMHIAVTAAVGIRLASLWLAIAVGMLAMASLEIHPAQRRSKTTSGASSAVRPSEL